jgi:hypothetical protein
MTELPRRTVTFLFTDIEGSTRLLNELGERYADVLADQRRLLREPFARHNGREVDTQGDSFFVAFANAGEAVGAAADAQTALAGHGWPQASRYACVWACTLASRSSPTTITSGSTSTAVPAWRQPRTAAGAVA